MTKAHLRIIGDTLVPLNVICYLHDDPYDWTSKTASYVMEEEDGTAITEAGSITAHVTQSFTADATTDLLTANAHGVKAGDQIVVATSGTLPTGLAASTRYFATEVSPNAFKLASTPGGAAIDITAAGSGTHTFYIVGSAQIDFGAGDVDEAGRFRLWVVSTSSTETQHFPDDELGIPVLIKAVGN